MDDKKVSEEDLEMWLEAVHFGSCCTDPVEQSSTVEQTKLWPIKTNENEQKKS